MHLLAQHGIALTQLTGTLFMDMNCAPHLHAKETARRFAPLRPSLEKGDTHD
jgi:hypothetical protein